MNRLLYIVLLIAVIAASVLATGDAVREPSQPILLAQYH